MNKAYVYYDIECKIYRSGRLLKTETLCPRVYTHKQCQMDLEDDFGIELGLHPEYELKSNYKESILPLYK